MTKFETNGTTQRMSQPQSTVDAFNQNVNYSSSQEEKASQIYRSQSAPVQAYQGSPSPWSSQRDGWSTVSSDRFSSPPGYLPSSSAEVSQKSGSSVSQRSSSSGTYTEPNLVRAESIRNMRINYAQRVRENRAVPGYVEMQLKKNPDTEIFDILINRDGDFIPVDWSHLRAQDVSKMNQFQNRKRILIGDTLVRDRKICPQQILDISDEPDEQWFLPPVTYITSEQMSVLININ